MAQSHDAAGRLEHQLRGMILGNKGGSERQDLLETGNTSTANSATIIPTSASRTQRKRPNQAQRRQFNAQMSASSLLQSPQRAEEWSHAPPNSHGVSQASDAASAPMQSQVPRRNLPPRNHSSQYRYTSDRPVFTVGSRQLNDRLSTIPQNGGAHPHLGNRLGHVPQDTPSRKIFQPQSNGLVRNQDHVVPSLAGISHPGQGQSFGTPGNWNQPGQLHPSRNHHNVSIPPQQQRSLYDPYAHEKRFGGEPPMISCNINNQAKMLEELSLRLIPGTAVSDAEIQAMEAFRVVVEDACREAIVKYESEQPSKDIFDVSTVQLKCFGSMASGFATKSSDMDLALLTPLSSPSPSSGQSHIPRLLEKALLDKCFGARLLVNTRVPIIKLCQLPSSELYTALCKAHEDWSGEVRSESKENQIIMAQIDTLKNASEVEIEASELPTKSPSSSVDDLIQHLSHDQNHQTYADHYGKAKILLQRMHCSDVHANKQSWTTQEATAMTKVCKAFVHGLQDEQLKLRLYKYKSFDFDVLLTDGSNLKSHARSLSGVHMQIEGERLVNAAQELSTILTKPLQATLAQIIECWQELCNTTDVAPLTYNKLLSELLNSLRSFHVLQLGVFEQAHDEEPQEYYYRMTQLVEKIRESRTVLPDVSLLAIASSSYLNGVRQLDGASKEMLVRQRSRCVIEPLISVAKLHQLLSLIDAYRTSSPDNAYGPEALAAIEEYAQITLEHPETDAGNWPPQLLVVVQKLLQFPDPRVSKTKDVMMKSRDRFSHALEFPREGVGIQCDINFSAELALHNTLLLRCYSISDPRVRIMVLFIKRWAKLRNINTPYRGSLSSYGYVLMVLHYLVNVVQPFVCPNLQLSSREPPEWLSPAQREALTTCQGRDVRFWRDEKELMDLAQRGMLNRNTDSVGMLLRGFFEYYATNRQLSTRNGRGFDWGRDVLSLRTLGGLVSKQSKGWTGARVSVEVAGDMQPASKQTAPTGSEVQASTEIAELGPARHDASTPTKNPQQALQAKKEVKEVKHRYLFAIEDPFEVDHNVARTVTHTGICAIRDEFRRAWRIIQDAGRMHADSEEVEGIMDEPKSKGAFSPRTLKETFEYLHGKLD